MTGPAPLNARARGLSRLHLAVAAAFVLSSLYVIAVGSWTTIVFDQWRIYDGYFSEDFPRNILVSQNGHRPVLPGLLFLVDIHFFGAHNYLLNTVGVVLALVAASFWSNKILRDDAFDPTLRHLAMALVWILLFWLANSRVLGHGNESLHVFPVLCGLFLAVWALLKYRPVRPTDAPSRGHVLAIVLSVLGCLIATFSFGIGLVTWPVVIAVAFIVRYPQRTVATIVAASIGGVSLYFLALPGATTPGSVDFRPIEILVDAAVWLGAPVFHAHRPLEFLSDELVIAGIAPVLGTVGMAVAGWSFLRAIRQRDRATDLEIWTMAILALGIGGAFLVAVARGSYFDALPQQRVGPRYLPWVCAFWAAAFTGAAVQVPRLRRGRSLAHWTLVGLAFLVPLGLLPSHSGKHMEFAKYKAEEAGVGLALGIRDPTVVDRLFRHSAVVDRLAEHLDAREIAVFAGGTEEELGTPFESHYHVMRRENLSAGQLRLDALTAGESVVLRFWGRLQGPVVEYDEVVVVDDAGIIVGRGTIRGVGHRWAREVGLLAKMVPQFGGYVPSYKPDRTYTIYAVSTSRRTADRLASIPASPDGSGQDSTSREP